MYWLFIIYIIIVIIVWTINNDLLPDKCSGDYTTWPTVDWINLWACGTFTTVHCLTYKLTRNPSSHSCQGFWSLHYWVHAGHEGSMWIVSISIVYVTRSVAIRVYGLRSSHLAPYFPFYKQYFAVREGSVALSMIFTVVFFVAISKAYLCFFW